MNEEQSPKHQSVEDNILDILDADVETTIVSDSNDSIIIENQSDASIQQKIDVVESISNDTEVVQKPSGTEQPTNQYIEEVDKDYEKSKKELDVLITTGQQGVAEMLALAQNSDHPRAYEVLSTLLGTVGVLVEKTMDMQYKKAMIRRMERIPEDTDTTQNQTNVQANMFFGSAAELQKLLIDSQKKIIDNKTSSSGLDE